MYNVFTNFHPVCSLLFLKKLYIAIIFIYFLRISCPVHCSVIISYYSLISTFYFAFLSRAYWWGLQVYSCGLIQLFLYVYSVYFHWVPYSLFWVIFSYYLSCYSTGKFSPFLSRNILHLFIGSLLLNLCYFFIICKKKLIHSRSWNGDIFKKNKKVKRRCTKIINHITCLYFIIHKTNDTNV